MNEFQEIPKQQEVSQLPEVPAESREFSSLKEVWNEFTTSVSEFTESIMEVFDSKPEVVEAREYGVSECAEVVKECFTPEVIENWGMMTMEQRNAVLQEYASGIGRAMGIDFKGVVWEQFPVENGTYTYGYNAGDGYVHINVDLLADPGQLMQVIDTIAHEARHQLQCEAIKNPEKFPIDEATIKEWAVGMATYTTEQPSAYDPWGYTYNPMELDSKYFGEAMVRELTKDLINNA